MGTWGTGLYSDDTAADVRDTYRDYIGDGVAGPNATDQLIEDFGDTLNSPTTACPFWLALADTQWRCGRLEDRVKEKALEIIASGTDLLLWKESVAEHRKRSVVLEKLRAKLVTAQPKLKKIKKRFREYCDWPIGEIVGYRLQSGKWVLFRVVGLFPDAGGIHPVCEVLDWSGESIPPAEEIASLKLRSGRFDTHPLLMGQLKEGDMPQDRVFRTGIILSPVLPWLPCDGAAWYRLDEVLEIEFSYK